MGLLDNMFGGGTAISLTLDRPTGSPGGVVGGNVMLVGGKKPFKLTKLRAHLIYVNVQSSNDGGFPQVDLRIIGEQVLAAGMDLAPGGQYPFSFRLTIPYDTLPSAHNCSYKIQVVADIPTVKDPTAEADFRVLPADRDQHRSLPYNQVLAQFPGLQAQDEETLCDALYKLFLECYSDGQKYMEAEPLLAHHMRTGTVRVRRQALQTWANLVDNRVQPQHLQSLYAIANVPGLDQDTFDEVIRAACKFAEEGALAMVQQLARMPDTHARTQVAQCMRFDAAKRFQGKREILVTLVQDPEASVRAAAVGALTDFQDDAQILYGVANMIDRDPSEEVQAAGIAFLALAHHAGHGDLALSVYEKHAQSPSERVRKEVAEVLHWQPEAAGPRLWALVQKLLQDPSEDVRRAIAFQFINMERFPQFLPLAQWCADNDPSEEVRREALRGLTRLMPVRQLVAYYQHKLAANPPTDVVYAVISGLRDHNKDREVQQLLTRLGQHPDHDVANAARDAMTY
jgi:hypothetical protein